MSVLGERIRERRTLKGWTQDFLAQEIGTSKHVISNWERAIANPDYKQIAILCNCFDISADYLIGLTEYPEPFFRDPFGQLQLFPSVDYSFKKESSWDLVKLLNSGVNLSINKRSTTLEDKKMLVDIIETTFNRLRQLEQETEDKILKESIPLEKDSYFEF